MRRMRVCVFFMPLAYLDDRRAPISSGMIILPDMLEAAWARALPGREAAARNEIIRLVLATLARRDRPPRLVNANH